MKKILLTTAAVAAISTSAFADMMENQFFLRGDVSGVMFSKFKTDGVKIKSNKVGFGIDVGAGYYVMDNVRVELVYNQPFSSNFKGSKATGAAIPAQAAATTVDVDTNIAYKHKPTIRALFARVSGDVVDLGMGKIFLTGGLGWSQVKNSVTLTKTTTTVVPLVNPVAANTSSKTDITFKAKNKNNLAWTVGAGAAFDVADGVHLDVAYSYRAYGKSKTAKKDNVELKGSATNFNSHNLSAGVRFDI